MSSSKIRPPPLTSSGLEFLVEAVGLASEPPEKYLVVLTAKENSPSDLLGVEMFYYGESTGRKRLYVDCSRLARSDSSRR